MATHLDKLLVFFAAASVASKSNLLLAQSSLLWLSKNCATCILKSALTLIVYNSTAYKPIIISFSEP